MWSLVAWVATLTLVAGSSNDYLLPTSVLPYHYDLRLLLDINPATNFTFYGIVHILVNCNKATDKIVLHGQKFSIKSDNVKVTGADDSYEVKAASITDDQLNFMTIQLDRDLKANENYTLVIPFYGNLEEELDGVYVSSYKNTTTDMKEWLIVTQFEAISARKGFPCFDEPMMKATFTVTIGHDKAFTAVSNMPLEKITDKDESEDNWLWEEMMKYRSKENPESKNIVWSHFEKSVPMSTYLLAFVVSKFVYLESPSNYSETKFRTWARSDAVNQAEYASAFGPKVLTYYEDYFGIKFPLPKQDMMAIPDFAAGAMENWGLITYRETALLYDPVESSLSAKQRVAEVVAHELAHQWFGNLVTMKWWSDLWLNEGFATYVASVGVNAIEPKWGRFDKESIDNIRTVLKLDALSSSHPVSVELKNPNTISEIFDTISYSKGSTIIRMMVMFLGEDVFKSGIKDYLTKYSYKNAEQDSLWQSLTEAAEKSKVLPDGLTVKRVMDTWTKRTGYPLLTVNTRDNEHLSISQKRYLALGSSSNATGSWWVPLKVIRQSIARSSEGPKVRWLGDHQGVSEPHKLDKSAGMNEWVLVNADMIALCRVNYDAENWRLLTQALDSDSYDSIPTLSRVQLLADSFELAWSNILDYNVPLKLVSYLHREKAFLPMQMGITALSSIGGVLSRTIDYGAYQKFMRKLLVPAYQEAGGLYAKTILNYDDADQVELQVLTSAWACKVKVPNCEQNAIDLFNDWMHTAEPDSNNPIPVELRGTVYCVAIARGSVEHWAFLFQRYQNSNVAAAKNIMMNGLTCTREIWIIKQYLEWTVERGPEVRSQDAPNVISSIARSSVGYYVAKPFLYQRIGDIDKALSGQSRRIGGIVKAVVSQFTTQNELDEFLEWRSKNEKYLDGSKLAIDQAVESAQVNISWLKRNQKNVVALLRQYAA